MDVMNENRSSRIDRSGPARLYSLDMAGCHADVPLQPSSGRAIMVQDVDALDQTQQSALMALVADPAGPAARPCRIVATTSVPLFERVMQGSFDSDLFYRLNRIHIKGGAHLSRGC